MNIRSATRAAAFALCCASLACLAPPVAAQDKIDRPVKLLVGFPAGGTADLIARVVADKMKDSLGQPVIVENRPGAIGRIAADAVKAAAPDGTTIMVMPIGPMAVVPHVYADITYDPVKDFTPIAIGATFQFAIAAGPRIGGEELERIRGVGEGESGPRLPTRRPAPAACRTSSACFSARASASRCCTSRTRARQRTSTT